MSLRKKRLFSTACHHDASSISSKRDMTVRTLFRSPKTRSISAGTPPGARLKCWLENFCNRVPFRNTAMLTAAVFLKSVWESLMRTNGSWACLNLAAGIRIYCERKDTCKNLAETSGCLGLPITLVPVSPTDRYRLAPPQTDQRLFYPLHEK